MKQKKIRQMLHIGLIIVFASIGTFMCFGCADQKEADSDLAIGWIGHSCYEIQYHDFRILIDPHTPDRFDYSRPKGRFDIVFATHKAADHFYFDGIEADAYLLASGAKDEFIRQRNSEGGILKDKTTRTKNNRSFSFWTVASFHDDQEGAAEGVNGILCFDFGGIKVVHLGDLGHVLEETHLNKIGPVDVLMVPVDGYFTIGIETAKAVLQQLDPRIVFPMHYKTEKSRTTAPIYTEKELLEGFQDLKRIHRSRLDIDKDTLNHRRQVIILDYLDQGKKPISGDILQPIQDSLTSKGPYLGQKPPGMKPEVFAPGIISTEDYEELCSGFLDSGRVFIFSRLKPGEDWKEKPTYWMVMKEGVWSEPVEVPFNDLHPYNFSVAADGTTFYFSTEWSEKKPRDLLEKTNIWRVKYANGIWSEPEKLGPEINTDSKSANYPTVAQDGTIYYMLDDPDGLGRVDLVFHKLIDNRYGERMNVGAPVNTALDELDPFIAPDESYIIFLGNYKDSRGSWDLYISYKDRGGNWTEPINMGNSINTSGWESRPYVTRDGKYLFFSRGDENPTWADIFWMDAKIIDDLKPDFHSSKEPS